MAASFVEFMQSPQFTFFVGQEQKPIVVHSAAIAATSEQFDALINGGMQEAESRCAKIEDVRVDDFIRFCEFAYRGDYTVPRWDEVPPEPVSEVEEQDEDAISESHQNRGFDFVFETQQNGGSLPVRTNDEYYGMSQEDYRRLHPKKKILKKRRWKAEQARHSLEPVESEPVEPEPVEPGPVEPEPDQPPSWLPEPMTKPEPSTVEVPRASKVLLRTQFNNRTYVPAITPKSLILANFAPKSNATASENFTPVLLAHARLYTFAHIRLITPLKALTLNKLHKTLLEFKLFPTRIPDIINLARYAYAAADLPDRADDGTLNELRELVVEYVVCESDTIGKCDEFVRYMEEGGEFVGDFWRLVRGYMV